MAMVLFTIDRQYMKTIHTIITTFGAIKLC